ncbi:MAG TPA: aspartate carbamoyltransferase [Candidatus Paceibacterota bacterium]
MKHVIKSQQFNKKFINSIFSIADKLKKKTESPLKGKIMASLFYEPSTRTRFSFESAMLRLGGSVITTENAREFSSIAKGETLEDSIRVINNYADVIILRHHEEGSSQRASLVSKIPVINAGDGIGQHPTQALLDLYTIKKEFGEIDEITIAFVGDLKHGRTIRSLAYLLGKYRRVKIYFVSPKALRVGNDIKTYLNKHKIRYFEIENLESIINKIDVLYQTRIQKERFKNIKDYKRFKGCYQINIKLADRMKLKSIIMHPLPRIDEILPEVDISRKAVYFKQAEYGLLIRMALLKYLLS